MKFCIVSLKDFCNVCDLKFLMLLIFNIMVKASATRKDAIGKTLPTKGASPKILWGCAKQKEMVSLCLMLSQFTKQLVESNQQGHK